MWVTKLHLWPLALFLPLVIIMSGCGGNAEEWLPKAAPAGTVVQVEEGIWQPAPGPSWQWQLSGPIDASLNAEMYDIDLFDTPEAVIEELHRKGRIVICYFSAGSRGAQARAFRRVEERPGSGQRFGGAFRLGA
ncbi:MAG: endo alpha-1,4 polygalactosaminidase [Anaerolineae bacterium]